MIDLSKLGNSSSRVLLEPRDIFMSLPSRVKKYEYPRDVQSEVWKKWFSIRNQNNCIIKMNTGSGKTVVGLLILKSCLNEGKGPAVYVVPDNFLVQQVCEEARKLGINFTNDETDLDYLTKKSILIINIQKLINGKSVFGMRPENNVNIGSIIIDDIHACLATIENQYTISIPAKDELYPIFIDMFKQSLIMQSESKYLDIIEDENPNINMLVPFWDWQKKHGEIYSAFQNNASKDYIKYSFPLLKDCLKLCNCMISSRCIEITPKCIPIHKISSFIHASRRIFMSATLSDDSAFISSLGLHPEDITTIISPEKANDIGDRLILFPQVMNKNISDDEIKKEIKKISLKHNVVVIVPSTFRAKYWEDVSDLTLNSLNIDTGVERLKKEHVGLVVLNNKYDGVDLPDEACRILVIDGLPKMRNEYDEFEMNADPNNKRLCSEQIQKIEQGMGRGVRSNSDFCVILLMGRGLADIIFGSDGYLYFSDATKKQFELSKQLWDQLNKPNIVEILEVANYSLSRNVQWVELSKNTLSEVNYSTKPNFNSVTVGIRNAFDFAEVARYEEAASILNEEMNRTANKELKGLLKQYIAEYCNFYNPNKAQEILLSANSDNRMVLKPIQGIQFTKILNKTGVQAQSLVDYVIQNNLEPNSYLLKINAFLEKLMFIPGTYKQFEAALKEISFLIGIYSNRPEDETGRGPDNFWDIGDSKFLVIECKNGTITETINKHDCNQLNGSINWFKNIYLNNSYSCFPIMIHNSDIFEFACSPDNNIRIITPELLEKFKCNVKNFAINLVQPDVFNNSIKINELLVQFKLLGKEIVENYSKKYRTSTKQIETF